MGDHKLRRDLWYVVLTDKSDHELITLAAFLLFWGRVSDIFNAKSVFTYGFVALGTLNLIISFLPDLYSFFILRAISGIVGAALIPASYRLMVIVFEPEELGRAFTIYGLSGPIANMTGFIVAGLVEYIPYKGQMVAWRWFFRILAAMIVSIYAFFLDGADGIASRCCWVILLDPYTCAPQTYHPYLEAARPRWLPLHALNDHPHYPRLHTWRI